MAGANSLPYQRDAALSVCCYRYEPQEMSFLENARTFFTAIPIVFLMFLGSIPTFLNYSSVHGDQTKISGNQVAYDIYVSAIRVGVPIVGVPFVLSVVTLFLSTTSQDTSSWPNRYPRKALFTSTFAVGGFIGTVFCFVDTINIRLIGVGVVLCLVGGVVPVVLALFGQNCKNFKSNLFELIIGDVLAVRTFILTLMTGDSRTPLFSLARSWGVCIKYIVPLCCEAVLVYSGCFAIRLAFSDDYPRRVPKFYDVCVFAAVVTPMLVVLLVPRLSRYCSPSPKTVWTMRDLDVVRCRPVTNIRDYRERLCFVEEWFSPASVWELASKTRRRSLRQWKFLVQQGKLN